MPANSIRRFPLLPILIIRFSQRVRKEYGNRMLFPLRAGIRISHHSVWDYHSIAERKIQGEGTFPCKKQNGSGKTSRLPEPLLPQTIPIAAVFLKRKTYSLILMTTPEPTVRPPSRIAKRRPSSMAMGVISSTSISTLSPGMHISVPSGRVMIPVTSVVRK